jgi:hypothetical protein
MASPQRIATCLFLLLSPVFGQSSLANLEPAATSVPVTTVAGAPLQEVETLQWTDAVVARLAVDDITSEYAEYFAFEDGKVAGSRLARRAASASCKTFPGDPSWPKDLVCDILNVLLGGALIPTKPIAAPCYDSRWGNKDAAKCADIADNFTNPYFHEADPTSNMWPIFQGRTCMPKNDTTGMSCTLGGYPEYAVKVTNVAQIQLAINFARAANIRLVIENTGHCYLGKSTGAGALSSWMHNMNQIDFLPDYQGPGYSGPALKVAAGVTVRQVYEAADKYGVTVLGAVSWVSRIQLAVYVLANVLPERRLGWWHDHRWRTESSCWHLWNVCRPRCSFPGRYREWPLHHCVRSLETRFVLGAPGR